MATDGIRNSTVAVTGGAGLIGSFLVEQLLNREKKVVVIDDFSKGCKENLEPWLNKIEVREGDLEDKRFSLEALDGCDIVYHLACRAYGISYSINNHLKILSHNERITTNLIDALEKIRPNHVLITSSSCVYSDELSSLDPEVPVFLNNPERANFGYGWAKRFLEQKTRLLEEVTGVSVTIVRPFNIYGERYRWVGEYSQAIPMLVKKIMDGSNPVSIWGSGTQRRCYTHASDCARIMIELVELGYVGSPVNIGGLETVTLEELVQLICRLAKLSPKLHFDLSKPEGRRIKSCDSLMLQNILPDVKEKVSLEEGIFRMLGWYRKTFEKEAP